MRFLWVKMLKIGVISPQLLTKAYNYQQIQGFQRFLVGTY
jgi:hypothetical protein